MNIEFIKSVDLPKKENKVFNVEYYLCTPEIESENLAKKEYEILLIKRDITSIVDVAYNKSPYKDRNKTLEFIKILYETETTPASITDILQDINK